MLDRIPGLHPDLAPEVLATYNRLNKLYPNMPHSISMGFLAKGDHAVTSNHGDIILSVLYFGMAPGLLKMDLEMRESTALVPADIITHEWGHVLTFAKGLENLRGELYVLRHEMIQAVLKNPNKYPISEYATVKGGLEALAEAFVLFDRDDKSTYADIAKVAFRDLRKG